MNNAINTVGGNSTLKTMSSNKNIMNLGSDCRIETEDSFDIGEESVANEKEVRAAVSRSLPKGRDTSSKFIGTLNYNQEIA
jgi:hypothetical protein